jgi:hypothetical protein
VNQVREFTEAGDNPHLVNLVALTVDAAAVLRRR